LGPKRPPVAAAPLPDAGCVVVEAGVVVWPKRPPVAGAEAPGLAPRAPPNRLPAGLEASAGGAPAGVVEPSAPNRGFAGVA
jgi:hypothetical protein